MASSPVPLTFRIRRYSASLKLPERYAMIAKAPPAITMGPIARPSRPSVRLTAFEAPTITSRVNGTQSQPRVTSHPLKKGMESVVEKPSGGHT